VVRSGFGIYRDNLPAFLFGADRFLPPFFGLEEFVFPQFLSPQNAALTQPLDVFAITYYPKFPYALQYSLNVERELARGLILSAGYFGTRGNHLASYTLAHSVDDASLDFSVESVNDPPASQDTFDRKGSRGPSDFDVRHNSVTNVVYDLPGRGRLLGGWQVSAVASVHSALPFTPVPAFDNADMQSLLTAERPDLVGNPDTGVCPNGARVGNSVMLV
jgi:hypothetical protein